MDRNLWSLCDVPMTGDIWEVDDGEPYERDFINRLLPSCTIGLEMSNLGLQSSGRGPADDGLASADLEQTLQAMTSHRSVLGYILLSRSTPVSIIRHSGVIFDGEQGKKYAGVIKRMSDAVQLGLEDVNGTDTDELRFMRIRTKRHEILISPNERYLLAVLHDPAST